MSRQRRTAGILLLGYVLVWTITPLSLPGFWPDLIVLIVLSVLTIVKVPQIRRPVQWLAFLLKSVPVVALILVAWVYFGFFPPLFFDATFRMRTFYFLRVDGRLFTACFKPVGAYAGGYGNFWISETPSWFPLVEWQVYFDRTVDHNFRDDNWDGQPIDNREVVRAYIQQEVIEAEKKPILLH